MWFQSFFLAIWSEAKHLASLSLHVSVISPIHSLPYRVTMELWKHMVALPCSKGLLYIKRHTSLSELLHTRNKVDLTGFKNRRPECFSTWSNANPGWLCTVLPVQGKNGWKWSKSVPAPSVRPCSQYELTHSNDCLQSPALPIKQEIKCKSWVSIQQLIKSELQGQAF